jgi:hypothetical protein
LLPDAESCFLSTHWLCHVKQQMISGRVDVAEGQFLLIAIHLLTACFGQSIWHIHLINLGGLPLAMVHIMIFGIVSGLLTAICHNVNLAVLGAKTPLEKIGVQIPVRRGLRTRFPLIPTAAFTKLAVWSICFGNLVTAPFTFFISFG